MPSPELLSQVHQWLADHHDDMVRDLQTLLRIASIEGEPAPNAPFGSENREALDMMLRLSEESGMRTRDLEGYIGYAEYGSGEKMVMTLGHLDVVPVGPGWAHDPFGAEIDGGYIYARGTSDDKGPTMAMFYAARAVQTCWPDIPVRIRSVFGCNEESGFQCVERYMKTEEVPTFGVAPDAGWPCIHGEKGIATIVLRRPLPSGPVSVLEVSGGQRANIVIDSCRVRARIDAEYRAPMEDHIAKSWDKNLSFSWDDDVLTIESVGKAAHGAIPFSGDSALTRAFRFLKESAPLEQERDLAYLLYTTHPGGNGLGISGADEPSGPLTLNAGIVHSDAKNLYITCNVRYPVTWRADELRDRALHFLSDIPGGYEIESIDDSPPLYFPLDHPLVQAITEVHAQETGENLEPGTMGGGTYARAVPNCVAIGTGWEGDGPAHETDERIAIESLRKIARIYGHLLLRLAEDAVRN